MRNKNLTICTLMFMVILSIVVNTAKGEEQIQQKQLEQIEKYISQRRKDIGDYYSFKFSGINLNAKSQINMLKVAERGVYSSLAAQAELAKDVLYIHGHRQKPHSHFTGLYARKFSTRTYFHRPYRHEIDLAAKQFAVMRSQITERKNRISARLDWEIKRLEIAENYALTIGLAELENKLKQNLNKPEPEPAHGVITGIVYSCEKPSVLIGDKIVYEGEEINGVKVIKINEDSVEFGMKEKSWEQKVGQKIDF